MTSSPIPIMADTGELEPPRRRSEHEALRVPCMCDRTVTNAPAHPSLPGAKSPRSRVRAPQDARASPSPFCPRVCVCACVCAPCTHNASPPGFAGISALSTQNAPWGSGSRSSTRPFRAKRQFVCEQRAAVPLNLLRTPREKSHSGGWHLSPERAGRRRAPRPRVCGGWRLWSAAPLLFQAFAFTRTPLPREHRSPGAGTWVCPADGGVRGAAKAGPGPRGVLGLGLGF